jgi:hypothetical protein
MTQTREQPRSLARALEGKTYCGKEWEHYKSNNYDMAQELRGSSASMAVRHDSVQRKYSAMMQAPLYAFSSSLILLPFELVP